MDRADGHRRAFSFSFTTSSCRLLTIKIKNRTAGVSGFLTMSTRCSWLCLWCSWMSLASLLSCQCLLRRCLVTL